MTDVSFLGETVMEALKNTLRTMETGVSRGTISSLQYSGVRPFSVDLDASSDYALEMNSDARNQVV